MELAANKTLAKEGRNPGREQDRTYVALQALMIKFSRTSNSDRDQEGGSYARSDGAE